MMYADKIDCLVTTTAQDNCIGRRHLVDILWNTCSFNCSGSTEITFIGEKNYSVKIYIMLGGDFNARADTHHDHTVVGSMQKQIFSTSVHSIRAVVVHCDNNCYSFPSINRFAGPHLLTQQHVKTQNGHDIPVDWNTIFHNNGIPCSVESLNRTNPLYFLHTYHYSPWQKAFIMP